MKKKNWKEINKFIKSLRHFPLTRQQMKTLKGQAINGDLIGAETGLNNILGRVKKDPASFNRGEILKKAHMDTNRIIKKYGRDYHTQFELCLKNPYEIIHVNQEG